MTSVLKNGPEQAWAVWQLTDGTIVVREGTPLGAGLRARISQGELLSNNQSIGVTLLRRGRHLLYRLLDRL